MKYRGFDHKKIKVTLKHGEFFAGICRIHSAEDNLREHGRAEAGLTLREHLFYESEIQNVTPLQVPGEGFRIAEADMLLRFSVIRSFSEHLVRIEDNEFPEKHDHNFFYYVSQISASELQAAVDYQKKRHDTFIYLIGSKPLEDSFDLHESVILIMQLESDPKNWERNRELVFRKPSIWELEEFEMSCFGLASYEDSLRKNLCRQYEELEYYGAYLDGELVGSCYSYSCEGYTGIDGLLVDLDYRDHLVGTSLLAHVADERPGQKIFLHAAANDTVVELYQKLGFCEVGRFYEYLCSDFLLDHGI